MRDAATVVHGVLGYQHPEVERERIDHAGPYAAARRAAGDHERVRLQIDEMAHERRAEEGAGVLLRQQHVPAARGDLLDEVVTVRRDVHDRRDLLREAAAVGGLLGRDVGIQHRPSASTEFLEQLLDVGDRLPRLLAAARRKLLDRVPERHRAGADGAVLHVDDEQRGPLPDSGGLAEAGGAIPALLLLADDAVPWTHDVASLRICCPVRAGGAGDDATLPASRLICQMDSTLW